MIDGNVFALKLHICSLYHLFLIMSAELMISALRRGQNGNEILAILDAITGDDSDAQTETVSAQPTSEWIEF